MQGVQEVGGATLQRRCAHLTTPESSQKGLAMKISISSEEILFLFKDINMMLCRTGIN